MIQFRSVTKTFRVGTTRKRVLDDVSFDISERQNLGIVGRNGAGKSTMIRLISGISLPDSGRITRGDLRVSWPLGFAGSFHSSLSGRENVRFAARVYGASIKKVTRYVEDFAELGDHFDMPLKTYSSGMKARLAFGLSMAIEFDVYLIDELTAVGDKNFRARCEAVFRERRETSSVIMASHSDGTLKKFCDTACVLEHGQLIFYPSVDAALNAYSEITAQ